MWFEEVQRFRQPWLWALFSAVFLVTVWTAWRANSWLPLAAGLAGPFLFWVMKMTVRVDAAAIHIRFLPFAWRKIPLAEIRSCAARTYNPLLEYGGWGIRFGFRSGMAYNVSGNRGVQLELANGKRVLIGSQRAEELAAVIEEARRSAQA